MVVLGQFLRNGCGQLEQKVLIVFCVSCLVH